MGELAKLKALYDNALEAWSKVTPFIQKVGPNGLWFFAGFAAAKLLSCLVS